MALDWIDDDKLLSAVDALLKKAKEAQTLAVDDFGRNVIDPFSAVFEIYGFNIDFNTWKASETTRQAQKTLQNHIGDFHQTVLGFVDGWENMGTGNIIDFLFLEKIKLSPR